MSSNNVLRKKYVIVAIVIVLIICVISVMLWHNNERKNTTAIKEITYMVGSEKRTISSENLESFYKIINKSKANEKIIEEDKVIKAGSYSCKVIFKDKSEEPIWFTSDTIAVDGILYAFSQEQCTELLSMMRLN